MVQKLGRTIRLEEGEQLVIRVDEVGVSRVDAPGGKVAINFLEHGSGLAVAAVPDAMLSDVVSAALLAAHVATEPSTQETGPGAHHASRAIPVERMTVLTDPAAASVPVGHVALVVWVGNIPVRFSVPRQVIRSALKTAMAHAAPARRHN